TGILPATAGAAVTIGSPLVADATNNAPPGSCTTNPCTYTQADNELIPVPQYVVPDSVAHGVIVSWSFKASSGHNGIQVLRPQGGGKYVDVGHSALISASSGSTILQSTTRLAVQAGDAIGLYNDSNALVMHTDLGSLPASAVVLAFDPAVSSAPVTPFASSGHSQLELQATIEPDADGDGFGDETQDQCPSD